MGANLTLAAIILLPALFLLSLLFVYRRAGRRGSRGVARLVAGNLLLLFFLCTLLLAGGEIYYRFICDRTDGFAVGLVSERWFARHYDLNNRGIRDDIDYELTLPGDRRRFTFLGDSYTNGHGLPDVGKRFVNILRARHAGWEIHFLGGDGHDTGLLLESLRRWTAEGYQIDNVVYVYCPNDISDMIPKWQESARRLYSQRPGFPFSGSYFLNTLYYRFKAQTDPGLRLYFDHVAEAYGNDRWPLQQGRLEQLQELIRGNGGRLLVVTFPFLERIDSDQYRAIHQKLAAFWRQGDVPHLDLSQAFDGLPLEEISVNAQDSHPNELGHWLAAAGIEHFLEQQLRAPVAEDDGE